MRKYRRFVELAKGFNFGVSWKNGDAICTNDATETTVIVERGYFREVTGRRRGSRQGNARELCFLNLLEDRFLSLINGRFSGCEKGRDGREYRVRIEQDCISGDPREEFDCYRFGTMTEYRRGEWRQTMAETAAEGGESFYKPTRDIARIFLDEDYNLLSFNANDRSYRFCSSATLAEAREEFGHLPAQELKKKAKKLLMLNAECLSLWAREGWWGWILESRDDENSEWESFDSLWGYLGETDCKLEGIRALLDHLEGVKGDEFLGENI